MKTKYFPQEIESKWQKVWKEAGIYKFGKIVNGKSSIVNNKYYTLVELPYPSGDLHIGHWFTFVAPDVFSRYKTMKGSHVFFPMGYDAFGLPAENAAIKRNVHPQDWTEKNIATMTTQFETMGTCIDWSHLTITCKPEYYTWNQWIFIKMYEKGIAYRGKTLSNWCPLDQTVLANEHVENGKCWRCGSVVVQKEVEQWFLKITDYAEKLLWKSDCNGVDWPKSVQVAQNEWIGKSEGKEIDFAVVGTDVKLTVFTTRPETTDGVSFIVIAPEHPLIEKLHLKENKEIAAYVEQALQKQEQDRLTDAKTKTGVDTGKKAINPVTDKEIPIYIADYVLGNYATGAVMGVPFADTRDKAFAEAFHLPILKTFFTARPKGKKRIEYHLRDWSVSRQRYWGTPVPMIHCDIDGIVPVPFDQLPVTLPYDVDYQPKGKAPLASNEEWMSVKCPKCGKDAKRDPETLDTFFDSSWYYYRYVDPKYTKAPFNPELIKQLMPVNIYFGGGEHTLGHTLYARFFTKFFKDLGLVDFDEFALKRVQHGIVLGPDGNKMSKSKGNVINPETQVAEFGTDAVRVYLSFMMPYDATGPWNPDAMYGAFRFLKRVWELQYKIQDTRYKIQNTDLFQMHSTIKKVGDDIAEIKNNTAIATIMKWLNYLEQKEAVSIEEFKNLLLILSPFAPHITEELWQRLLTSDNLPLTIENSHNSQSSIVNSQYFHSIHQQSWPEYDESLTTSDTVIIAVQINGKLRDTISIQQSASSDQEEVEKLARESIKIQQHIVGKTIKKVIYVPGKILNFVV